MEINLVSLPEKTTWIESLRTNVEEKMWKYG
jgi:hypothetical protein